MMQVTAQIEGNSGKIHVSGRFVFDMHRDLKNAYEPILYSPDIKKLEINLGKVEHIDCSAFGMLLILREKAVKSRKTVELTHCQGKVKQTLNVAQFDKLFDMT